MEKAAETFFRERPGRWLLWFAFLGAPTAWALQFTILYFATPYLCGRSWQPIVLGITLSALLLAVFSLLAAHRCWRAAGSESHTDQGSIMGRTRMMSQLGLAGGLFFMLLVLVQALPAAFLDPCR